MMESTEDRKRDDLAPRARYRACRHAIWDVLIQPLMRAGTVEIGFNRLPKYTMQQPFAEYDDGVQAVLT